MLPAMAIPEPRPHATWAEVYDRVYELGFGELYARLTETTLAVIAARVPPPARVVDLGAGTGRVALPLAARGYAVTAVEPCAEMLAVLAGRPGGEGVAQVRATMADFRAGAPFDLALCLFTVVAYIVEEVELDRSFAAVAAALRPGGRLLLDLPTVAVFAGFRHTRDGLDRTVTITGQGRYRYQEDTRVVVDGRVLRYTDDFPLRHWPRAETLARLAAQGLVLEEDLSGSFPGSGAALLLLRREG